MSRAGLWLLHRLSGGILVIGMALHLYVMHFHSVDALAIESVRARLQSPIWRGFNAVLLACVLYHGLYGLWGIALEYVRPGRALGAIRWTLYASGAGLMAAGLGFLT